jgi:RNA polymerase sigma-70 factor (ECF subfamily)
VGRAGRFDERFRDFFAREYADIVTGVALMTGNRDVATEAVDEAVARAWMRTRRGEEIASIGAWVRVVALNIARNAFRSRDAERRARERLKQAVPPPDPAPPGWGIDIQRALVTLSRRQREVTVLRYLFDLPVSQIAAELGISEGTVKNALFRARIALTHVLADHAAPEVHVEVG